VRMGRRRRKGWDYSRKYNSDASACAAMISHTGERLTGSIMFLGFPDIIDEGRLNVERSNVG